MSTIHKKIMVYFVEDVPSGFRPKAGDLIIALTPMACYVFDSLGIAYVIPEDLYDQKAIKRDEDDYFFDQLTWFRKLDDIVECVIPFRDEAYIGLPWLYYYFLKQAVDNPIVYLYRLRSMLQRIGHDKIDKISYLSQDRSQMPQGLRTEATLLYPGNLMYKHLLPLYCAEHDLLYDIIDRRLLLPLEGAPGAINERGLKQIVEDWGRGNRILGDLMWYVKRWWSLFGSRTFTVPRTGAGPTGTKKITFLFLSMGYGLCNHASEALRHGHRVLLQRDGHIYEHTGLRLQKLGEMPECNGSFTGEYFKEVAEMPKFDSEIVSWIKEKADCDITGIIREKFRIFLDHVCPSIILFYKFYKDFYQEEAVNYVVGHSLWFLQDFAAMAAAKAIPFARGVLCQHGGGEVFDNHFSIMVRLGVADIFFPYSHELKDHYEEKRKNIPVRLAQQIVNSAYYRSLYEKTKNSRKRKKGSCTKETIFYVPTFINFYASRFNGSEYTPGWYNRLQLRMVEYFATKTEFDFIWKGLSSADDMVNPIPQYIRDKGYTNIGCSDRRFVHHLAKADRVITDFGSSAFCEALTAGLPTICISHTSVKVRHAMRQKLGKSLQDFTDVQEALAILDEFLQGDPQDYVHAVFCKENTESFVSSLEQISTTVAS